MFVFYRVKEWVPTGIDFGYLKKPKQKKKEKDLGFQDGFTFCEMNTKKESEWKSRL